MAVSTASPGPYAPGSTTYSLINRFRDRGLATPITKDVLVRAGVSESLVPRTIQTLQTLDLIDETGQPTPTMQKLRSVPEAEYEAALTEWLQSAYAEVFQFVDPSKDDAVRVRDAFRAYAPHGQQDRMVSLFLTLCEQAGIVSPSKNEGKQAPRNSSRPAKPSAPRSKPPVPRGQVQASPPANPSSTHLPPAINGMLASIPKNGKGWTKEDRDKFLAAFGVVLDFAVPLVTADMLDLGEEDES